MDCASASSKNDIEFLSTYGTLHVRVKEVLDVLDIINRQSTGTKPPVKGKHVCDFFVYCSISVLRDDTLVKVCNTKIHQYESNGSGNLSIDEEFLFDISSLDTLAVRLHAFSCDAIIVDHDEISPPICVGEYLIPVSRLGCGISVVQWYQMHSPEHVPLRCAVKLEIFYNNEGYACRKFDQDTFSNHDTDVLLHVLETTHCTNANISKFDERSTDPSLISAGADPTLLSVLIPPNGGAEGNVSEEDDEQNDRILASGLIDYCFIVGPVESESSFSPGAALSGELSLGEELSTAPSTGLSTPVMHSDICMWDRFPRSDYSDSPLPEKVEWFACPQGSLSVFDSNRPQPTYSSFLLSASGGGIEQYGVSLTFFVAMSEPQGMDYAHDSEALQWKRVGASTGGNGHEVKTDASRPEFQWCEEHTPGTVCSSDDEEWWHHGEDFLRDFSLQYRDGRTPGSAERNPHKPVCIKTEWTAVTVALTSRLPFVPQLTDCLAYIYTHRLLPPLIEWERAHNGAGLYSGDAAAGHMKTARGKIRKLFKLKCSDILVNLSMDFPVPVPGFLGVDVRLPSIGRQDTGCAAGSTSSAESAQTIRFRLPLAEALPQCCYPVEALFSQLGPRMALDVILCALFECKMMFHSSDVSKLPGICEAVRILLYPLKWVHVYVPIVPASLLDLLEAPVPFMLGTHSDWLQLLPMECLRDVVIIDCDIAALDWGSVSIPALPADIDRWLMLSIKMLLSSTESAAKVTCEHCHASIHSATQEPCAPRHGETKIGLLLQLLFLDTMVNLLCQVPSSLFFLSPTCPVFNRQLFLEVFAIPEYRPFLEVLIDTNSFQRFVDSIHSCESHFFIRCVREMQRQRLTSSASTEVAREATALTTVTDTAHNMILDRRKKGAKDSTQRVSKKSHEKKSRVPRLHTEVLRLPSLAVKLFPDWVESFAGFSSSPFPVGVPAPFFSAALQRILFTRLKLYETILQAQLHKLTQSVFAEAETVSKGRSENVSEACKSKDLDPESPDNGTDTGAGAGAVHSLHWKEIILCVDIGDDSDTSIAVPSVPPTRLVNDAEGTMAHSCPTGANDPNSSDRDAHVEKSVGWSESTGVGMSRDLESFESSSERMSTPHKMSISIPAPSVTSPTATLLQTPSVPIVENHTQSPTSPHNHAPTAQIPSPTPDTPLPAGGGGGGGGGPPAVSPKSSARKRVVRFDDHRHTPASSSSKDSESVGKRRHSVSYCSDRAAPRGYDKFNSFEIDEVTGIARRTASPVPLSTASSTSSRKDGRAHSFSSNSMDSVESGGRPIAQTLSKGSSWESNLHKIDEVSSTYAKFPNPVGLELDTSINHVGVHLFRQSIDESDIDASQHSYMHHHPQEWSWQCVCFDQEALERRSLIATSWTLERLASECSLNIEEIEHAHKVVLRNVDSVAAIKQQCEREEALILMASPHRPPLPSYKHDASAQGDNINAFDEDRQHGSEFYSDASKSFFPSPSKRKLVQENFKSLLEEGSSVAHFLQIAISGANHLSECSMDILMEDCSLSLQKAGVRLSLVDTLKNARRHGLDKLSPANSMSGNFSPCNDSSSVAASASSTVGQIHTAAFESLVRLLTTVLQACLEHRDYLVAFSLLEVAGLYFHVRNTPQVSTAHPSSSSSSSSTHKADKVAPEVEFLSARVFHHPIYQSSLLWRAVLNERLPMDLHAMRRAAARRRGSIDQGGDGDDSDVGDDDGDGEQSRGVREEGGRGGGGGGGGFRTTANGHNHDVVFAVHSLLHLMHSVGVNSARATLFIQAVARDYALDLKTYYKLQRFTGRLWTNHRRIFSPKHSNKPPNKFDTASDDKKETSVLENADAGSEEGGILKSQLIAHEDDADMQGRAQGVRVSRISLGDDLNLSRARNIDLRIADLQNSSRDAPQNTSRQQRSLGAALGLTIQIDTSFHDEDHKKIRGEKKSADSDSDSDSDSGEDKRGLESTDRVTSIKKSNGRLKVDFSLQGDTEKGRLVSRPNSNANVQSPSSLETVSMLESPPSPHAVAIPLRPAVVLGGAGEGGTSGSPLHGDDSMRGIKSFFSKLTGGSSNQKTHVIKTATDANNSASQQRRDNQKQQQQQQPSTTVRDGVSPPKFAAFAITTASYAGSSLVDQHLEPSPLTPHTTELIAMAMQCKDDDKHFKKAARSGDGNINSASTSAGERRIGMNPTTPFGAVSYADRFGLFDEPIDYIEVPLKGLSGTRTTAMQVHEQWLLTGCRNGNVGVTDLESGDTVSLQRHSSSSVRNFQGVTVLQLVKNGGCFVTACSSGVVNVWQLPMRRNSYMATAPASPTAPAAPEPVKKKSFTQLLSATLRGSREAAPISRAGSPVPTAATRNNRKCIATLKVHTALVTCVIAESWGGPSNADLAKGATNWFIASGDVQGRVSVSEGSSGVQAAGARAGHYSRYASSDIHFASMPTDVKSKSHSTNVHLKGTITSMVFADGSGRGGTTIPATGRTGLPASSGRPFSPRLHRGPAMLAIGSSAGLVEVLDLTTMQSMYRVSGHDGAVTGILSVRPEELLTCSTDRSVKLWDLRMRNVGMKVCGPGDRYLEERMLGKDEILRSANAAINAMAVGGEDHSLVLTASGDGTVNMWDIRYDISKPCLTLRGHSNGVSAVEWNGDDGFIHTGSLDGCVRRWDSISGRCLQMHRVFQHYGIAKFATSQSSLSAVTHDERAGSSQSVTVHGVTADGSDTAADSVEKSWLVAMSTSGAVRAYQTAMFPS